MGRAFSVQERSRTPTQAHENSEPNVTGRAESRFPIMSSGSICSHPYDLTNLLDTFTFALTLALWFTKGSPPPPRVSSNPPDSCSPSARPVRPTPTQVSEVPVPTAARTSEPLHWRQVESTNYGIYIQNLRAIGCPESTIRDIIVADLSAVYRDRRREVARVTTAGYWQAGFGTSVPDGDELVRLDDEERFALEALLGVQQAAPAEELGEPANREVLGIEGMPEPRQTAIRETCDQYETAKEALLAITEERELTDEEQQSFVNLQAAEDQALAAQFTPEERFEFEVRNSPSARYLRESLVGIEIQEAEFRQLFQARRELDVRLSTATTGEAALEARLAYETAFNQMLGPERADLLENGEPSETPQWVDTDTQPQPASDNP